MLRSGEEVEKEACFILGLLAIKQEHQHAIADQVTIFSGALHSVPEAPCCLVHCVRMQAGAVPACGTGQERGMDLAARLHA